MGQLWVKYVNFLGLKLAKKSHDLDTVFLNLLRMSFQITSWENVSLASSFAVYKEAGLKGIDSDVLDYARL